MLPRTVIRRSTEFSNCCWQAFCVATVFAPFMQLAYCMSCDQNDRNPTSANALNRAPTDAEHHAGHGAARPAGPGPLRRPHGGDRERKRDQRDGQRDRDHVHGALEVADQHHRDQAEHREDQRRPRHAAGAPGRQAEAAAVALAGGTVTGGGGVPAAGGR